MKKIMVVLWMILGESKQQKVQPYEVFVTQVDEFSHHTVILHQPVLSIALT